MGMSSQAGVWVAMEPAGPHLLTSWLAEGVISSEGGCPCWVKIVGRERDWKWEMRVVTFLREVVVMEAKWFCMSIIRRAVVILATEVEELAHYSRVRSHAIRVRSRVVKAVEEGGDRYDVIVIAGIRL